MQLGNKKVFFLIIFLFIIILLLILVSVTRTKTTSQNTNEINIPTTIPSNQEITITPMIDPSQATTALPTLAQEQGGGVNVDAPDVQASEQEIQKLYPLLPYNQDIPLSTGITASIIIPQQEQQNNAWTLKVQIFGINFETSPTQSDYSVMKQSFREAANDVFTWIRNNNADPSKIYFVWGDKTYIQHLAEQWLQE